MNKIQRILTSDLFHVALASGVTLLLLALTSCAPAIPAETVDYEATIAALEAENIAIGEIEANIGANEVQTEIVVVTATPEPTEEPVIISADAVVAASPTSPYAECPLPIQYFEEMMWGGEPANQDKPNPNFEEYGGYTAWVKYGSDAAHLNKDPMVIVQRCAWQVVGWLYRNPRIGFTASLSDDGLKTETCTWWEVKGSHVATNACYLQIKNPLDAKGLWKAYGTIDRGSYRQPFCIGTDKTNLVADEACKFPGGNTDLGLLKYPYGLNFPTD